MQLVTIAAVTKSWKGRVESLLDGLNNKTATLASVAEELHLIGMEISKVKNEFSCETDNPKDVHDEVMQMLFDFSIKCFEVSSEIMKNKLKYGTQI